MAKKKSKAQDLSKLNRRDLLELLVDEMEENKALRAQLDEANAQLEDRRIVMAESGSLAEAAVRLSGLLDAADKAVEIYRNNARYCSGSADKYTE